MSTAAAAFFINTCGEVCLGFVVSVLRNQPPDLIEFAAQYFADLLETRDESLVMGAKTMTQKDEPMLDESEETMDSNEDMEIRARRANYGRRKSICAEGFDPTTEEDDDEVHKVVHPKTDCQRKRLESIIAKMLMFSSLDAEQTQQILDAMFERIVVPGEHVIDEGDDGDNFYIIERGTYDIFVNDEAKNPQHKGTYNGYGAFGELALMYNCPRLATIIATSPGSLWAMDRRTFQRIIVRNQFLKRQQFEVFLESVPLLSTLTKEERMKVADAMVTRNYENDDVIIQQGDPADYFYMLVSGRVVVKRTGDDPSRPNAEVVLTVYSPGNYFGELALIQNQPRAASAIADGKVKCAVLDVQAFERLLGPCKELLMRNIPLYEQQLSEIYKDFNIKE